MRGSRRSPSACKVSENTAHAETKDLPFGRLAQGTTEPCCATVLHKVHLHGRRVRDNETLITPPVPAHHHGEKHAGGGAGGGMHSSAAKTQRRRKSSTGSRVGSEAAAGHEKHIRIRPSVGPTEARRAVGDGVQRVSETGWQAHGSHGEHVHGAAARACACSDEMKNPTAVIRLLHNRPRAPRRTERGCCQKATNKGGGKKNQTSEVSS